MTDMEIIQKALGLAKSRLDETPSFVLYISVSNQLEYILKILDGSETNIGRLKDILLGRYAVREFEDTDPELSDALSDAQEVVNRMVKLYRI